MSGIVLNVSQILTHSVLRVTLQGRQYYYYHFTDEETQVLRGYHIVYMG